MREHYYQGHFDQIPQPEDQPDSKDSFVQLSKDEFELLSKEKQSEYLKEGRRRHDFIHPLYGPMVDDPKVEWKALPGMKPMWTDIDRDYVPPKPQPQQSRAKQPKHLRSTGKPFDRRQSGLYPDQFEI
jgi:hypothetical protein